MVGGKVRMWNGTTPDCVSDFPDKQWYKLDSYVCGNQILQTEGSMVGDRENPKKIWSEWQMLWWLQNDSTESERVNEGYLG